jgi:hypothetical protein
MKRRAFLAGLGASIGALTTVSYFDMGASWKKHGDLYAFDGIDRSVHPESVFAFDPDRLERLEHMDAFVDPQTNLIYSAESILKKYYNDRTVANLTFSGSAELFARMR